MGYIAIIRLAWAIEEVEDQVELYRKILSRKERKQKTILLTKPF